MVFKSTAQRTPSLKLGENEKAVKCLDERKSSFNNRVIATRAENAARISEYEEAEKAGQK